MIAAIYARKSTEQNGVADEAKSVTRQVDNAREYAVRNGWTVAEHHIYVDDGVSGAEFERRPGLMQLMYAVGSKSPFQALVISEESRLGRESIETSYLLKQLMQADVRVFSYLSKREILLNNAMDKIMLVIQSTSDEMERERARQRTHDALHRRARAGHVTGGRTFGYDNLNVVSPSGERSHVERRINDAQAAVVRRIFQMCADGSGFTSIAKRLNAEGAISPRAQRERPNAWAPSSVREVLIASCIAESSSGTARRSGIDGVRSSSTTARTKSGFEPKSQPSASCQTTSGRPLTADSMLPDASISGAQAVGFMVAQPADPSHVTCSPGWPDVRFAGED